MSPTETTSTPPRRSRTAPARLVGVLAWRGLRRNLAASLLLLATIATATTTLSLTFALGSVSDVPWDQTRDMTRGPDVWVRAERADQLSDILADPDVLQAGPILPLYGITDLDGGLGSQLVKSLFKVTIDVAARYRHSNVALARSRALYVHLEGQLRLLFGLSCLLIFVAFGVV